MLLDISWRSRRSPTVFPPYARPTLIAHRGASWDAPEHTSRLRTGAETGGRLRRARSAIDQGRRAVCLHDTTLERTTNVEELFPERAQTVNGKRSGRSSNSRWPRFKSSTPGRGRARVRRSPGAEFQQMIDLVRGKAGIIPETKRRAVTAVAG